METKDKNKRHGNFDPKGRNEHQDIWERRNAAETKNGGTHHNDWNENDSMERDRDYRYDDEQRDMSAGDYINIDHSEYNRGNNRYGWYEPEE